MIEVIEKKGKKIFTCDICGNKFVNDINETEHPSEVDVYRELVVCKSHRNQTKEWIKENWHFILETISTNSAPFDIKDLITKSFDQGYYILWSGDSSLLYDIVYKETIEKAIESIEYDLHARKDQYVYQIIENGKAMNFYIDKKVILE